MGQPITIDTKMHGLDGITGAFLLQGQKTALVETGPKTSFDHVIGGLELNGVEALDWIIVTHIHLDHAGAAGTLARRFPEARVGVHPVGAPHLVDPEKLWKSASRIYGQRMEALWGGIDPIDASRINVIADGDEIDLGDRRLRAVETPGHAYHHHAYLDDTSGILYTGDALGVRLPEVGVVRPATPPPEFHLEKAIASIERIKSLQPETLCLTHFGSHDRGARVLSVDELCAEAIDALKLWDAWVSAAREGKPELSEIAEAVRSQARSFLERDLAPEETARMEQTTSYEMNTSGYLRYQDKKEKAG